MADPILKESILETIKKLIGFEDSYNAFDQDILIGINTALSILTQIGVGPQTGYRISGYSETWGDYLGVNTANLEDVKTYIYLRTRRIFDPPASNSVIQAIDNEIKELEWRINVSVDRLDN